MEFNSITARAVGSQDWPHPLGAQASFSSATLCVI